MSQSLRWVSWIVHAADLVDAVLAVDRVGGLQRAGGERRRDRERLHDRAGLEAIGDRAVAPRVGVATRCSRSGCTRGRREREDLPGDRVDHDDRAALGLVGAHAPRRARARRRAGSPRRWSEYDVVALRAPARRVTPSKDEPPAPIAQAVHLLDVAAQLLVERELQAVLALAVGRDEAEQRAGELAPRVVAVPLAFDRRGRGWGAACFFASPRSRTSSASSLDDASLEPDEAVLACASLS